MRRISNLGTNKKQFLLERVTASLSIIPTLVIALAPVVSFSVWYTRVAIITIFILLILYFYMSAYRAYIKKDWYKCKTIFPLLGSLIGVSLWVLLPFPPDFESKRKWLPFLLSLSLILSAIVDYRAYFGLLKEDNPETHVAQPKEQD